LDKPPTILQRKPAEDGPNVWEKKRAENAEREAREERENGIAMEREREDCRRRRLQMEVTGTIEYDRPNVEELEPFNEMHRLYEIKKLLANAGGTANAKAKLPENK